MYQSNVTTSPHVVFRLPGYKCLGEGSQICALLWRLQHPHCHLCRRTGILAWYAIMSPDWAWLYFYNFFMPPPFEEWWRGIKCYPCPCVCACVRPCVRPLSKFGVRSITFERLLRFHSNLVCLYKTSKHRSSSIWVTIHWFLTELWAFYKKHSTKIGVRSITFERLHRFDSYLASW